MNHSPNPQAQENLPLDNFIPHCIPLFHKYKWVYKFKMIEILFTENTKNIPEVFSQFFISGGDSDLDIFSKLLQQEHQAYPSTWPEEILAFVHECVNLRFQEDIYERPNQTEMKTNFSLPRKWSRKKYEEVSHLASYIRENSLELGCDAIIDIGAGLGYLSSSLIESCGIPVIAIESKSQMVETASSTENGPNTVQYINLELNSSISTQLSPLLTDYNKVCITGLHACGSLTPWSLSLFLEDPKYSFLAIVPCCYHKMNQDSYSSIPMSLAMKLELQRIRDVEFQLVRNEAFCRIASQRSSEKFTADLKNETNHVFFRGLLELYFHQGSVEVQTNKRKGWKGKLDGFEEYVRKMIGPGGKFSLRGDYNLHERNLFQLFKEKITLLPVIAGVIVMQGALQSIAEKLILTDRLKFLEESGKVEAKLVRVIPENISPREMILSARKIMPQSLLE